MSLLEDIQVKHVCDNKFCPSVYYTFTLGDLFGNCVEMKTQKGIVTNPSVQIVRKLRFNAYSRAVQ